MAASVIFQGDERDVGSIESFGRFLDEVDRADEFEVWVRFSSGKAICMLRNRENAWLMYLPAEGAAGCTTSGDSNRTDYVTYRLSNGQVDEYPGAWCVPVEDCYRGLAYFFVNDGARPEWLQWEET